MVEEDKSEANFVTLVRALSDWAATDRPKASTQ